MKTHSGEKPYKYSHCDKAFSHRSNLNSNFRKYSREKLYQCSLTNKTFFTQWCSFIDIGRHILGRNHTNAAFVTSLFHIEMILIDILRHIPGRTHTNAAIVIKLLYKEVILKVILGNTQVRNCTNVDIVTRVSRNM